MYLKVHAVPDARKESVTEEKDGTLVIAVKEPAEQNRANKRIREIIAARLKLPTEKVRILTGHRSRSKMFSIEH